MTDSEPPSWSGATVPVNTVLAETGAGSLADSASDDSFFRDVARLSVDDAPPGFARQGQLVAGRYRLDELLGRGSFGSVWQAHDRISGESVAVKVLSRGPVPLSPRLRREVLALRLLRLPGVVRLRDEGIDGEHAFLVMDLARGAPFPGVPVPCTWAQLARPFTSLLRTLQRAHALRVLHRDLKPDNVWVAEDGTATVLDFGLAVAEAAALSRITGRTQVMGTPAFISPEQLAGESASARSDLYAVGIMAFWALTGRHLHVRSTLAELVQARMTMPAPPIAMVAPDVPPRVAAAIDEMLAIDPTDRPSAARVLELVRNDAPNADLDPIERSRTLDSLLAETPSHAAHDGAALEVLFKGHDRLFHTRQDAARLLFDRTSGDRDLIDAELRRWCEAGLAHAEAGRYVVRREALARIAVDAELLVSLDLPPGASSSDVVSDKHRSLAAALPPGAPARLTHLLAGASELDALSALRLAEETFAQADAKRQAGKLAEAANWFSEALRIAREGARMAADPPLELARLRGHVLSRWAASALSEQTPQAIDFVLHELSIEQPWTPLFDQLSTLLQAALAVRAWTPRAADLIFATPPFEDAVLEQRRFELCARAARRSSIEREEAVLLDMAAWAVRAGGDEPGAALAGRTGHLRYFQGRFAESAELHARAATLHESAADRASAMLSAASAYLEAFRWEEAQSVASEARALAASIRHAPFEARAEWLLRCVAYRSGRADRDGPDLALCAAAAELHHTDLDGLIHLGEAAVAWRAGDASQAAALAGRSHALWSETGFLLGRLLSGGLLATLGQSPPDAAALTEEAGRCAMPGVGIQALALLGASVPEAEATALAEAIPREHWDVRMEILSMTECLSRLGITSA